MKGNKAYDMHSHTGAYIHPRKPPMKGTCTPGNTTAALHPAAKTHSQQTLHRERKAQARRGTHMQWTVPHSQEAGAEIRELGPW